VFDPFELQNRIAYDRMARMGHVLASIATVDELRNPLPAIDTSGWLGSSIRGWNVLCLAAGGGRHSALYHAAGAIVTVVDISDGMLELDRRVAQELKFNVRLIQSSMSSMPSLKDDEFDLVIQPVSTCYVSDVGVVFREVARVLKPNGLYISQHKQPASLQGTLVPVQGRYAMDTEIGKPANPVPVSQPSPLREPGAIEMAHPLESILGGICRSGMVIEDVSEPDHTNPISPPGSIGHRSRFLPPYLRIKARKQTQLPESSKIILS
jgi:ubiquinone/menaquinone biosynthesis C-methylase UbiE